MTMLELLGKSERWTQQAEARNPIGEACESSNSLATRWCLMGAASKCYGKGKEMHAVLDKLDTATGYRIIAWNDDLERTHAEVLELLKKLDI